MDKDRAIRFISSQSMLYASTTIVNFGNYASNLILVRLLAPAAFADFGFCVTVMMLTSFIGTTLQQVLARFTAIYVQEENAGQVAALARRARGAAWAGGTLLALAGALPYGRWGHLFRLETPAVMAILGIGLPFFLVVHVERGLFQGRQQFGRLAASYQVEMWVRLVGASGLAWVGLGAGGAVVGLTLSLVVTYLVVTLIQFRQGGLQRSEGALEETAAVVRFALPILFSQAGIIMILYGDLLLVNAFFSAEEAASFTVLALLGRAVYFVNYSITLVMFPQTARREATAGDGRRVFLASLGLAGIPLAGISASMVLFPCWVVRVMFGAGYVGISGLVGPYAIAASLFVLAILIVSYHLSQGRYVTTGMTVAAGVLQAVAIGLFHETFNQIVTLRLGILAGLFAMVLAWEFVRKAAEEEEPTVYVRNP